MQHFLCEKYSILSDVESEDIFYGCQSPYKPHGSINIQGFQVGLPIIYTSWFPHHNGACIWQVLSFEYYGKLPTRGSTCKPGYIKQACPLYQTKNNGVVGTVQSH